MNYYPALLKGSPDGTVELLKVFNNTIDAFILEPRVFGRIYLYTRGNDTYWLSGATPDGTLPLGPEWRGELRGNIGDKLFFGFRNKLEVTTDLINFTELSDISSPSLDSDNFGDQLCLPTHTDNIVSDGTVSGTWRTPFSCDSIERTLDENGFFIGLGKTQDTIMIGNIKDRSARVLATFPAERERLSFYRTLTLLVILVNNQELWFANSAGDTLRQVYVHDDKLISSTREEGSVLHFQKQRMY